MSLSPQTPPPPAPFAVGPSFRSSDVVYRWRRILLSIAVAAMGVIDLLSALLSHIPGRLLALRRLVPTEVLDTSRTFTLLAGALLLVTAWGLRRGKHRAFVIALFLCAVSVPVNLLKAFDFEEATVAAALMFLLGVSAEAFRVKSRRLSLAALRSRTLWALVALAVYAVAGSWVVKRLYGYQPSLPAAFADAAYRLFGIGSPAVLATDRLPPGAFRVIRWYLNSLPVMSLTLMLAAAVAALRPAAHRSRHRAQADRVSELLRAHGESSVGAFALADDSDYFFSSNGRAVIAYRFETDTLLAIGDPIGPPEELPSLLAAFADHCRERDWQFAFFQARPERLAQYRDFGWRALHIGEEPVLWVERFTLEGSAVGDVRRHSRRVEAAGLEVRHFFPLPDPTAFDPGRDHDHLLDQLRVVSQEWLRTRHGLEKGFCMGRFEPARLRESWLAVVWNPGVRRVEAFVTWVPVWGRQGWVLDLVRRRADAPGGVMEFLVVRSVEAARARGDHLLSLALSALAKVDQEPIEPEAAAPGVADELGGTREFIKEHLARFYDFEGLFHWKKKFNPSFEDRYLVYPHPLALPRVALALARAQSPGGLRSYFRRGSGLPAPRGRSSSPART